MLSYRIEYMKFFCYVEQVQEIKTCNESVFAKLFAGAVINAHEDLKKIAQKKHSVEMINNCKSFWSRFVQRMQLVYVYECNHLIL